MKKQDQNDANIFFDNYDYTESDTGPGVGLYHGSMNRFKSVQDFRAQKRKRKIKNLQNKIKS